MTHQTIDAWDVAEDVFLSVALLALLAELALGAVVLLRSQGSLPAKLLGLSLVLRPAALWLWGLSYLLVPQYEIHFTSWIGVATGFDWVMAATLYLLPVVAALDLAFALTYPMPVKPLRRKLWLLGLAFVPALLLAGFSLTQMERTAGVVVDGSRHSEFETGFLVTFSVGWEAFHLAVALTLLVAAGITAALICRHRATTADSPLTRRRLRFISRFVSIPVAFAGACLLVALLLDLLVVNPPAGHETRSVFWRSAEGVLTAAGAFALAVVVPIGMAYGILRYRIVDWDRRARQGARNTLAYGLVGVAFVSAFFLVGEAAEALFSLGTGSDVAGLVGAGLLALGLHPLQNATMRIARRIIPPTDLRTSQLRIRRRDVYRAALLDAVVDGTPRPQDRIRFGALATRLGISAHEAALIEAEELGHPGRRPSGEHDLRASQGRLARGHGRGSLTKGHKKRRRRAAKAGQPS